MEPNNKVPAHQEPLWRGFVADKSLMKCVRAPDKESAEKLLRQANRVEGGIYITVLGEDFGMPKPATTPAYQGAKYLWYGWVNGVRLFQPVTTSKGQDSAREMLRHANGLDRSVWVHVVCLQEVTS